MEDCHRLKTRNNSKRVIIKLTKRKDAEKLRQFTKNEIVESMGVSSPIFISNSLPVYC